MKRALVLLAMTALPSIAFAGEPEGPRKAQALFDSGRNAFAQGRVDEACRAFEQSMAIEPANGTLLNLARCHEKQGKLELARIEYQRVASVATRDGQVARGAIARKRAAELDGTAAHPDAAVPASAPLGAPPRADVVPPPKDEVPYLLIGIVSGSVGLASLTVGSVLGAVALSGVTRDDPDEDGCGIEAGCRPPSPSEVEASEAQGDAAITLLAIGSVLAITGGTFLTLAAVGAQESSEPAKGRVALVPTVGGASLHVTW